MKKKKLLLLVFFFAAVMLGLLIEKMRPEHGQGVTEKSDSRQIFLSMLGEMRYTLAAFVWLKADYYHHDAEASGENWTENKSLMPLIRLVTYLDPHFVQAYDFGGYHLAVNLKKPEEGINLLQEGIRNNPGSFDLLWEMGYILSEQKRYKEAIPYLLQALPLVEQKSTMDEVAEKKLWIVSRLAHGYYAEKDYDKTLQYCREWLVMKPNYNWPRQKIEEIEKMKN
ncbi:MAG: tetratricopeptide repeat protein [Candidatus Xenobiia bacterium LiM19]